MLIDNKKANSPCMFDKFKDLKNVGTFHIVTGYFSVGGLLFLFDTLKEDIWEYQIILGDLVSSENEKSRPINLLNDSIDIHSALELSPKVKSLIAQIKNSRINIKTLRPNFCHAKVYIFQSKDKKEEKNYFISGSSNLTEAGIGLKKSSNIELNIYETGTNANYRETLDWFLSLWTNKEAKDTIEIDKK